MRQFLRQFEVLWLKLLAVTTPRGVELDQHVLDDTRDVICVYT